MPPTPDTPWSTPPPLTCLRRLILASLLIKAAWFSRSTTWGGDGDPSVPSRSQPRPEGIPRLDPAPSPPHWPEPPWPLSGGCMNPAPDIRDPPRSPGGSFPHQVDPRPLSDSQWIPDTPQQISDPSPIPGSPPADPRTSQWIPDPPSRPQTPSSDPSLPAAPPSCPPRQRPVLPTPS